jgi:hypothetical protein
VERTGDSVERKAEWCQKELGMLLDATVETIRI